MTISTGVLGSDLLVGRQGRRGNVQVCPSVAACVREAVQHRARLVNCQYRIGFSRKNGTNESTPHSSGDPRVQNFKPFVGGLAPSETAGADQLYTIVRRWAGHPRARFSVCIVGGSHDGCGMRPMIPMSARARTAGMYKVTAVVYLFSTLRRHEGTVLLCRLCVQEVMQNISAKTIVFLDHNSAIHVR